MITIQTYFEQEWRRAWEDARHGSGGILIFYGGGDSPDLDLSELRQCAGKGHHLFQPRLPCAAYEPFFDWIRAAWDGGSKREVLEFLQDRPHFPLVESHLQRVLQREAVFRDEWLIPIGPEIRSAQARMDTLLADLWLHLQRSTEASLYLLERFHLAGPSTVRLLVELLQKPRWDLPVLLIVMLEQPHHLVGFPEWDAFLKAAEDRTVSLLSQGSRLDVFLLEKPPVEDLDVALTRARENFALYALQESAHVLRTLKERFSQDRISTRELDVSFLLGKVLSCLQENENALIQLSHAAYLALQLGDMESLFQIYLQQVLVYLKLRMPEPARDLLTRLPHLTHELPEILDLQHRWVQSLADFLLDGKVDYPALKRLIREMEGRGLNNLSSYLQTNLNYLQRVWQFEGWNAMLAECEAIERYCTLTSHQYRLSILAHVRGLLEQSRGSPSQALRYFNRAIALRERLGMPLELVKIYNSTGYFCFTRGMLSRALSYYRKSLSHLQQVNDLQEIILTLYNIGVVYLMGLKLDWALEYLQSIFKLIQEADLPSLPFHPVWEILCLIAWGHLWLNHEGRAHHYLRLALLAGADLSHPLVEILQRLLGCPRQEWSSKDIARELERLGEFPTARWRANLDHLVKGECESLTPSNLSKLFYPIESVLSAARQNANLKRLSERIHDLEFLRSLQAAMVRAHSWQDLVKEAVRIVQNSFMIPRIFLLLKNERGQMEIVYSDPQTANETVNLLALEPHLPQAGSLTWLQENLPRGWDSAVVVPMAHHETVLGWLFCGLGEGLGDLNDEIVQTLALGASQVAMAVELKQVNERLIRAATVDSLTGLLNRQEIYRQMINEQRRVHRYKGQNYGPFSLLFIDLDHFKYYNERFGTSLGDEILRLFANLLKRVLRDVDICGRFGGDEFLVILPETGLEGAQAAARRIMDELGRCKHFVNEINLFLRRRVEIPPERSLTCCIGITEYNNTLSLDIDEVIAVTDNALFEAKRSVHNMILVLPLQPPLQKDPQEGR